MSDNKLVPGDIVMAAFLQAREHDRGLHAGRKFHPCVVMGFLSPDKAILCEISSTPPRIPVP